MHVADGQARVTARLRITGPAYELLQAQEGGWTQLAVLPRGAGALLDTGHCVTEAGLEQAIQAAEDWLMPHAQRLRGWRSSTWPAACAPACARPWTRPARNGTSSRSNSSSCGSWTGSPVDSRPAGR